MKVLSNGRWQKRNKNKPLKRLAGEKNHSQALQLVNGFKRLNWH
jgi:hypothetical protein